MYSIRVIPSGWETKFHTHKKQNYILYIINIFYIFRNETGRQNILNEMVADIA
jgi:hypothetical protein